MISELFSNGVVKNVFVSILMAALGFASHQLVESAGQEKTLVQHDQQIEKLFVGQSQTHTEVQDLTVAIARVEGKLDVLNQKIDDDRSHGRSR